MSKVIGLKEAVSMVNDGDILAFGGNVLHRSPMSFVRELIRAQKKKLRLVKTAGAHDIDILCAMDMVESVDAGFVSYESKFGLASHYRKSVEAGKVIANEHACYTVISALRGAVTNVPFMPISGLKISNLITNYDYFVVVEDPFTGIPVTLVKTIVPDLAIIHVQECDSEGNVSIEGPYFEDILISKAAKKVIITTESVANHRYYNKNPKDIVIPGFMVEAVVHIPKGASPTSCYGKYDINEASLEEFISFKDKEEIMSYVKKFEKIDHVKRREW